MLVIDWEKVLDDRPSELKHKSPAMRLLELAVGLAVRDGCTSSESVFGWLTAMSQETFIDLWREVFPDLVSNGYFDEVHGGYEQFVLNRGMYFLRVYGGNKDMFLSRLDRILQTLDIQNRDSVTFPPLSTSLE